MFRFVKLSDKSSKNTYSFSTPVGINGTLVIENNNIFIKNASDIFNNGLTEKEKSKLLFVAGNLIKHNYPNKYIYATS